MNFKLLYFTNIAVLAMVLLNISINAMVPMQQKAPIHLYIQNNTDYDFDINQEGRTFSNKIKAHEFKEFRQLPWSSIKEDKKEARFYFNNKNIRFPSRPWALQLLLTAYTKLGKINAVLLTTSTAGPSSGTQTIEEDSNNEYHIFITLEGNLDDNFGWSTVRLEIETEQMRLEKERREIERSRLLRTIEKQPFEKLLEMRRQ